MDYELGVFIEELSKFSAEGPGVTRVPFTKESRQGWDIYARRWKILA